MRIAFLTSVPASVRSADYHRDQATIESLRALGHLVEPIVLAPPGLTLWQCLRSRLFKQFGLSVRTECDRATLQGWAASAGRELARQPYDIAFSQSTHFTAHLRCPIPVVNWADAVFDCIVDFYPTHRNMDGWSIRAGHRAERLALHRSNLTILTSTWAAKRAAHRYQVPEPRLAVVSRAAYLPSTPERELVLAARQRPARELKCLLVGNDWHRKGGDIAVESIRRLRAQQIDARLTVVGMEVPETDLREPWLRRVPHLHKGVAEEWDRLQQVFLQSDVCLLPSRADFTPNVVYEAFAFGIPVIASPVGAIPEMIDPGRTGFVASRVEDAAEYAEFLAHLARDRRLLRGMASEARGKYEREFNQPVVTRKLSICLERVRYPKRPER